VPREGALRRLLFFAYYFPPLGGAGSQRALSFARHLPRHGWEVAVVTPKTGVYGRDPSLDAEGLPGVRVLRTGTWEPSVLLKGLRPGRGADDTGSAGGEFVEEAEVGAVGQAVRTAVRKALYFPDACRGWIGAAVRAARAEHGRVPFHAVLSSSPPVSAHVAAHRFADAAGLPLVLDFRDVWLDAAAGGGRAARLHRGLVAAARGATTVSGPYAAWLRESGCAAEPEVVPNGFEEEASTAARVGRPEPWLVHAGTTYAGRQDFASVAEVVRGLRGEGSPLTLRMIGRVDADTRAALAPSVAAGAASIEGFRSSGEVRGILGAAAGILVAAWSGSDTASAGHVPAKLFEAMPAGRPVILVAARGSEAARVGERVGLRAVAPGAGAELRELLRALGRGETPVGTLPDPAAIREFTRARQSERLAAVLDRVVAERGR
jgi:glycosyltransferase involved in cell wall biosynthesis